MKSKFFLILFVGAYLFSTGFLFAKRRTWEDFSGLIDQYGRRFKEHLIPHERVWITETYLPSLEGSVLFVGTQNYNVGYHNLVKNPELFETIDLDENKKAYGSPYGHTTADIRFYNPGYQYDHVCLFGCLAMHASRGIDEIYSVDNKEKIMVALLNADSLVKEGGTLFVDMIMGSNSGFRKDLEHINEKFWNKIIDEFPLNKYEVIFKGYSTNYDDRILWWARKKN